MTWPKAKTNSHLVLVSGINKKNIEANCPNADSSEPENGMMKDKDKNKITHSFRAHSFMSLMADLRQDINRVSSFIRCLNGTFP